MSRRPLPPSHYRNPSSSSNHQQQPHPAAHHSLTRYPQNPHRNSLHKPQTVETGLSDCTYTEYEYDYFHPSQNACHKDDRFTTDYNTYSDDSGSTRIPHYENDDESFRRSSRFSSERNFARKGRDKVIPVAHVDPRRAFAAPPLDGGGSGSPHDADQIGWKVYHEIDSPLSETVPHGPPQHPSQLPTRAAELRPQSSMSSGVTSAIVDGCGGRCETFENVCYFFLQLVFMMGILIGVSLSIAGWVLRKSAARNLQVFVYIGVLLAMVSALLLAIQYSARRGTRRRKMAVKMAAKRAPIPMETLHQHHHARAQQQQQQPLMVAVPDGGQRVVPQAMRPLPHVDEQGVPWWRRRDVV